MSEPNSLYLNVHIKPAEREAFLQQQPALMLPDRMWQAWWERRSMYQKQELREIPAYRCAQHADVLREFLRDQRMACVEHYDLEQEQWTIVSLFFSENYTEILPMLNMLKSLERYIVPESEGQALIYDYYWGGSAIMAYISYRNGQAHVMDYVDMQELPVEKQQEVRSMMDAITEEFSKKFGQE